MCYIDSVFFYVYEILRCCVHICVCLWISEVSMYLPVIVMQHMLRKLIFNMRRKEGVKRGMESVGERQD